VALGLALAACLALTLPSAGAHPQPPRATSFPLPAEFAVPNDVVAGPDGALWSSDGSLGVVWRITTSGRIRSFDVGGQPAAITAAHGALWIADSSGNRIVRLATDGTATPYPLPSPESFPTAIVEGPDGALWFTEARGDRIGRITAAGAVTEFPLPAGALPGPIVAGPDGALWLSLRNTNEIARLTMAGTITDRYGLASPDADPLGLVFGPDGALWIAQHADASIARMGLDGTVTRTFDVPRGGPDSLALGPDGALWFTQGSDGRVGTLDPGFEGPIEAAPATFAMRAGKPATRTVATFTDPDPDARPRDYDVSIAWGDGRRSDGTVQRTGHGGFAVRGRHAYARPGTYRVVVRIRGEGGDRAEVESTAVVRG
jgi:virginiamycin B lyase